MSLGFGTDNVTFVPEGDRLRIWDVYNWRKIVVDVHRLYARMQTDAYNQLQLEVASYLNEVAKDEKQAELYNHADKMLKALATPFGPTPAQAPTPATGEPAIWWVRLSDTPVESFFEEDYEDAFDFDGPATGHLVYGNLTLNDLEGLEVPFPAQGAEAAFQLLVPSADGISIESIAEDEPLPLVDEYCGSQGVSAHGNSVNLDFEARIVADHMGCCPVRKLSDGLYMTLYFHLALKPEERIATRLSSRRYKAVAKALLESDFEEIQTGPRWRIFERKGYVVHLYRGLEGKESAGHSEMPPFVVMGAAGENSTPTVRADLLEQILDVSAT
ncbi:hypothetical protein KQI84_06415 [bacterium]|nr:hypothetical protein [bacterium]